MAAPHLLKQALLLRSCIHTYKHFTVRAVAARPRLWCSTAILPPSEKPNGNKLNSVNNTLNLRRGHYSSSSVRLEDEPEYRKWKDKEDEILNDIEPIHLLTKEILHSPRYMDGGRLTVEDEKIVVEKLLAYHPHSDDKMGCGLESIMLPNSENGWVGLTCMTKLLPLKSLLIPTSGLLWKVMCNL
ncbi:unnamed protein product [Vicia faba]|uniref:Protein DCL, chloroplastic n=1 Tax=Vicia faba TaxID=3906 RepID=A0AAV0ZSA7_VICFA|nr:unnamed protein product [Vicia faba]